MAHNARRPGLDPEDRDRLIGMTEAARRMVGKGGKRPSRETVRRWAHPNVGCRPLGKAGPQLVLMTVRLNGELLTLPEWVDAFEAERSRLGLSGADNAVMPKQRRRPPKDEEA